MRSTLLSFTVVIAALVGACGPSTHGSDDDDDGPSDGGTDHCTPGTTEACYEGLPGTENVGPCHGGTRTCQNIGVWGLCDGQVTSLPEVCADGIDNNCDGQVDNALDQDGDGFTACTGDCCDSVAAGCQSPERVGPGAIEVNGNELDDDCDGTVDNEVTAVDCDGGLASNSGNAMDYAKAMDICETTTATDPHWGVISARFAFADGTGAPLPEQRSIRGEFGATTVQRGASMVVMSTANAAATGHTNPATAPWQSTEHGTGSQYPADWFAANGNNLPNAPGCPDPAPPIPLPGFFSANDPVMLELRIRTPANAQSFSLRTNFMSAEFPEYVCTEFNDFFVVLLDSTWNGTPANPTDKNLAFYVSPAGARTPVGVNLAHGNTGLFTVCQNGATGCSGSVPGTINTCTSSGELVGTGFEAPEPFGAPCQSSPIDQTGGGTGWLTTSGNVRGGEIITLRIALWDTSDGLYDSLALADAFQWSLLPSEPGTVIGFPGN